MSTAPGHTHAHRRCAPTEAPTIFTFHSRPVAAIHGRFVSTGPSFLPSHPHSFKPANPHSFLRGVASNHAPQTPPRDAFGQQIQRVRRSERSVARITVSGVVSAVNQIPGMLSVVQRDTAKSADAATTAPTNALVPSTRGTHSPSKNNPRIGPMKYAVYLARNGSRDSPVCRLPTGERLRLQGRPRWTWRPWRARPLPAPWL